jgi:hypothetical protein
LAGLCLVGLFFHPSTFNIVPESGSLNSRAGSSRKAQMIHVVTLYSVRVEAVGRFVGSIGWGGEWCTLSRAVAPALIASDLLQHEPSANASFLSASTVLFVCLDFWISLEAYQRGRQSPDCQRLFVARRQMAASAFEFGAFCFPNRADAEIAGMPARYGTDSAHA